jgi:hypothetical protein
MLHWFFFSFITRSDLIHLENSAFTLSQTFSLVLTEDGVLDRTSEDSCYVQTRVICKDYDIFVILLLTCYCNSL